MASSPLLAEASVIAAMAIVLPLWQGRPLGVADCPGCDIGLRPRQARLCEECRVEARCRSRRRWWEEHGSEWRRNRRLIAA